MIIVAYAGHAHRRHLDHERRVNFLTKKAPYKGLGADSEEKHEPVSDINTAVVDSLKVLDPKRPIREADMAINRRNVRL